jgi:hypothetical protein
MVSIPSFEPGEVAAAMKDPSLEYLRALGQADASPIAIIEKLFGEGKIFSAELGAIAPFKADVAFYLEKIINEGIESALVDALNK